MMVATATVSTVPPAISASHAPDSGARPTGVPSGGRTNSGEVKIRAAAGDEFDAAQYGQAVALFTEVALADTFADFLTIPAYERMP